VFFRAPLHWSSPPISHCYLVVYVPGPQLHTYIGQQYPEAETLIRVSMSSITLKGFTTHKMQQSDSVNAHASVRLHCIKTKEAVLKVIAGSLQHSEQPVDPWNTRTQPATTEQAVRHLPRRHAENFLCAHSQNLISLFVHDGPRTSFHCAHAGVNRLSFNNGLLDAVSARSYGVNQLSSSCAPPLCNVEYKPLPPCHRQPP
jgi:hypothetical protein